MGHCTPTMQIFTFPRLPIACGIHILFQVGFTIAREGEQFISELLTILYSSPNIRSLGTSCELSNCAVK
jgi:hypothetical protein